MRLPAILLTATTVLASACAASSPPVAPAPAMTPVPPSSMAETPSTGGLDPKRVQKEVDTILEQVAQTRNLSVLQHVRVDVVSRSGIRKYVQSSMYDDITPEELERIGRVDATLGVIPKGSNLENVLLDMLEDGVLGFYDPKRKALFIGDFVPEALLSTVVSHEIVHGLQDMHFDLEAFSKPQEHHADADEARRYLTEGGAQAANLAWSSGEDGLSAIEEPVLRALANQSMGLQGQGPHPILLRAMQMPYTDGTVTMIRLVTQQGWSAVDALYADPPTTTEQMLHIDKLLAREPRVPIDIDHERVAAAIDMKTMWFDEVGEAALLSMLAEVLPPNAARKAAAGWGGDDLVAFEPKHPSDPGNATTVVVMTIWDTEGDAVEFESAMHTYLSKILSGEQTFVERRGDRVLFGAGVPASMHAHLSPAVWQSTTVSESSHDPKHSPP